MKLVGAIGESPIAISEGEGNEGRAGVSVSDGVNPVVEVGADDEVTLEYILCMDIAVPGTKGVLISSSKLQLQNCKVVGNVDVIPVAGAVGGIGG